MKSKIYFSRSILLLTIILVISTSVGTFFACSKEPIYKESLIKVDSIKVEYFPTLIYPSNLFSVSLHGTISSNGCSSLSYCKFYIQNQDLIIEAWKKTEVNAGVCPTVMVYLDQSLIFSEKQLPEDFTIKIKQPDGTFLEKPMN
jgi:hypothetical protein